LQSEQVTQLQFWL